MQLNQEQNEKKHNYFYKITNLISGKYYYGIHSTDNLEDGYMGSSKYLKEDIKVLGKENFKKDIIIDYSTRKEASDYEVTILTKEVLQDQLSYNLSAAGMNWKIYYPTEEQKLKISNSLKGREFTSEHLEKLSKSARKFRTPEEKLHLKLVNTGKKHTEETKLKMSNSQTGRECKQETREKISRSQLGEKNHRFGKKHTSEWKQEQSKRFKGRSNPPLSIETREKISKNNAGNKPCIIDDIYFINLTSAAKHFNISTYIVKQRINSFDELWANWKYK